MCSIPQVLSGCGIGRNSAVETVAVSSRLPLSPKWPLTAMNIESSPDAVAEKAQLI
jgi:hypothetical protein